MKIFIDVDNTILEHSNFYSKNTEGRTHKLIANNMDVNKEAVINMYKTAITSSANIIKELWEKDNVYILTKYPNEEFDLIKQQRLAQILEISHNELISATDSSNIPKYINVKLEVNKMEYIQELFKTDDVSNFILIDDYSENIMEWEALGGIGIKFFNEYNSPTHPTIGFSIRDFKIFPMMFKRKNLQKLFIRYNNPIMADLLINNIIRNNFFKNQINSSHYLVDIASVVHEDAYTQLNLPEIKAPIKYNYLTFIHEYYNLREEDNPDYWINKFDSLFNNNDFLIFKSPLDINTQHLAFDSNKLKENFLSLKVLTDDDTNARDYDIFLTLNQKKNYIDSEIYHQKITHIINVLFNDI